MKVFAPNLPKVDILFIELPYYVENPFELLIADHATHFDAQTIQTLLESAGLKIDTVQTEWVPKEISVVAGNLPATGINTPISFANPPVLSLLEWLRSVVSHAASVAGRSRRFGLFGTSIAATWLFSELEGKVAFFVDEDINRTGRTHFDLPIYSPGEIPEGSDVYVVLPPKISGQVARRLHSGKVIYHTVPDPG